MWQAKLASPFIYQRYVDTDYAAKTAQIGKTIHLGLQRNATGVGVQFEDFAHAVVPRQGFAERDLLFMERCAGVKGMAIVKRGSASAPANQPVMYFADEADLRRKVKHAGNGKGYFVPYSRTQGVVDAFGWLSIDGRKRLAGYQMARRNRHPSVSGRDLARVERLARIIRGGPPDDALPVRWSCCLDDDCTCWHKVISSVCRTCCCR